MAAGGIGPGIVALDADDEAAGKLIVATGLHAAEPAVRLMSAEPRAEKIAAGREVGPVLLGPQAARMAAYEAAAPVPRRHQRRRRLVDRSAHVGRDRRTRQRDQRSRSQQEFPHDAPPPRDDERSSMPRAHAQRCSLLATPGWICERRQIRAPLRRRARKPYLPRAETLSPAQHNSPWTSGRTTPLEQRT